MNAKYSYPEEDNPFMAKDTLSMPYKSAESLKLLCLERVMQLNDYSLLQKLINTINELLSRKEEAVHPYSLEELQNRCDKATAELEAGGGMDGDVFFSELNNYIQSR